MLLSISLFCFVCALLLRERHRILSRKENLVWILSSIIFGFVTSVHIISNIFTGEGLTDGSVYHLLYGLKGSGFHDYLTVIVVSCLMLVISIVIPVLWSRRYNKKSRQYLQRFNFKLFTAYLFLILAIGINVLNNQFVWDKVKASEIVFNFEDFNRETVVVSRPEVKRNFVFIYAESFERTYFDESKFPGLISHLRELEASGISFTNVNQVKDTGWTIAGMVASQCGIPLLTSSSNPPIEETGVFLKDSVCLGDVLHDEGYNLAYMGGASLDFAGKGYFYNTHSFDYVLGKYELLKELKNSEYLNDWGLFDDSMLPLAFDKFVELSEKEEPFGLFMLTLDTHQPNGNLSASCNNLKYADGENAILNSIFCSDYLISEFVKKIQNSEYGEDTVIVIVSDHLALQNTASDVLNDPREDRRDLVIILDPSNDEHSYISKFASTLDTGPTFMHVLGYDVSLGLGRNLFLEDSIIGDVEKVNSAINMWADDISEF